jgi:hypothetical protein
MIHRAKIILAIALWILFALILHGMSQGWHRPDHPTHVRTI